MNKALFDTWLKKFKKLDPLTCNVRVSNCHSIEKYYGDLDKLYNSDRCVNLLEQFIYTPSDKRLESKPRHIVPIDGDVYFETNTLKSALKLYIEFRDNRLIEDLKTAPNIEPDKHDGSYELVRETVKSLATVPMEQLDVCDLDMLYFMTIGTWKNGVNAKRQKIEGSHLNTTEKNRLLAVLDGVKEKAVQQVYGNIEGGKSTDWSIGMFGTGFQTFAKKADKDSIQRFITLCVKLKDATEDETMFTMVQEVVESGIKGMRSASASVMLHCLKPNTFPIMNGAVNDTSVLFELEGVSLIKPDALEYYIQNSKQIKKFRDEKCIFRNYRTMDLKLSVYGRKDIENDLISIWKISHGNDGSFTEGERESYLDQGIVAVHRDTGRGQGKEFETGIEVGDYFYLCYGNNGIKLLGKIASAATQLEGKPQGWLKRSYKLIANSEKPDDKYTFPQKGWTPNYNSTAWRVPRTDYAELEKNILLPCFDIRLDQLIPDELLPPDAIPKPDKDSNVKPSIELKSYSKEEFLNEVFISEQQYDEISIILHRKKNIILQGAPGVGKTFAAKRLSYSIMGCIDDSRVEMVQFHQNYSYEDFVMGFRPVEGGGFELRSGIFLQFCLKASNDPTRDYYFIIDEINRGNLSKILGELLMLIENDKRGTKFAVPLTYKPHTRFYVPDNVYIIGMMNTADRSLAMLDYALRRRFCFIEIEPAFNTASFKKHLSESGIHSEVVEKIISRLAYLNDKIASDSNLGRGFRLGHSYFCNPSTDENWYQSVVQYEINPLIEEYWFDNEEKAQEYMDYLLSDVK